MNNDEFETKLLNLSAAARQSTGPPVDVRSRVLSTLVETSVVSSFDYVSLACCSVAIMTAVTTVIIWFPSWQTVVDPWGVYFI